MRDALGVGATVPSRTSPGVGCIRDLPPFNAVSSMNRTGNEGQPSNRMPESWRKGRASIAAPAVEVAGLADHAAADKKRHATADALTGGQHLWDLARARNLDLADNS